MKRGRSRRTLPLSQPIVLAFAAVALVILVCAVRLHRQWRRARGALSWSWAPDPELQSRWLDFATPLLPWPLRRAHLVTQVWTSGAFLALAVLTAAVSSSAQGLLVAAWCLVLAVAAAWQAVRVGRSRHRRASTD